MLLYLLLLRVHFYGRPIYEPDLNAAPHFPNYREDLVGRLAAFSVFTSSRFVAKKIM